MRRCWPGLLRGQTTPPDPASRGRCDPPDPRPIYVGGGQAAILRRACCRLTADGGKIPTSTHLPAARTCCSGDRLNRDGYVRDLWRSIGRERLTLATPADARFLRHPEAAMPFLLQRFGRKPARHGHRSGPSSCHGEASPTGAPLAQGGRVPCTTGHEAQADESEPGPGLLKSRTLTCPCVGCRKTGSGMRRNCGFRGAVQDVEKPPGCPRSAFLQPVDERSAGTGGCGANEAGVQPRRPLQDGNTLALARAVNPPWAQGTKRSGGSG